MLAAFVTDVVVVMMFPDLVTVGPDVVEIVYVNDAS